MDGSPAVQSMFLKSKGIEVQDVDEARDIEEGGEEHKRISDAFAAVSECGRAKKKYFLMAGVQSQEGTGLLSHRLAYAFVSSNDHTFFLGGAVRFL